MAVTFPSVPTSSNSNTNPKICCALSARMIPPPSPTCTHFIQVRPIPHRLVSQTPNSLSHAATAFPVDRASSPLVG